MNHLQVKRIVRQNQ